VTPDFLNADPAATAAPVLTTPRPPGPAASQNTATGAIRWPEAARTSGAGPNPFADDYESALNTVPKGKRVELMSRLQVQEGAKAFRAALGQVYGQNPDEQALTEKIMRDRHVAPDLAVELIRDEQLSKQVRDAVTDLSATYEDGSLVYPSMVAFLKDPVAASLAQDDIKALRELEDVIRHNEQQDEGIAMQTMRSIPSSLVTAGKHIGQLPAMLVDAIRESAVYESGKDAEGKPVKRAVLWNMEPSATGVMWTPQFTDDSVAPPIKMADKLADDPNDPLLAFRDTARDMGGLRTYFDAVVRRIEPNPVESPMTLMLRGDFSEMASSFPQYFVSNMVPTFTALALTAATRQPQLGMGLLSSMSAGQGYDEAVAEGQSAKAAVVRGTIYGASEQFFEQQGTFKLLKEIDQRAPMTWKEFRHFVMVEAPVRGGVSEGLTQVSQQSGAYLTGNEKGLDNLWVNTLDCVLVGALGDGIISGTSASAKMLLDAATYTKEEQEALRSKAAVERAVESKLRERDPKAFTALVDDMLTKAKAAKTVFIAADKLAGLFQNNDQLLFEFTDKVAIPRETVLAAKKAKTDLQIDHAKLIVEMAGDPKLQQIQMDLRFTQEGQSANDRIAQREQIKKDLVELQKLVKGMTPDGPLPQRVKAIRESLMKFRDTNGKKFSKAAIEDYLMLILARAKISSKQRGISMEQWFDEWGLQVETGVRIAKAPGNKYVIVPVGQQTPQELLADYMTRQRQFLSLKLSQTQYTSLDQVAIEDPDLFTAWSEEFAALNPRTSPSGVQLFQMPIAEEPQSFNEQDAVAAATNNPDGFTYNPRTGQLVPTGRLGMNEELYSVSIHPDLSLKNATAAQLAAWLKSPTVKALLSRAGFFHGGWQSAGEHFNDVSLVTRDRAFAEWAGKKANQQGIAALHKIDAALSREENGKAFIDTGGTGDPVAGAPDPLTRLDAFIKQYMAETGNEAPTFFNQNSELKDFVAMKRGRQVSTARPGGEAPVVDDDQNLAIVGYTPKTKANKKIMAQFANKIRMHRVQRTIETAKGKVKKWVIEGMLINRDQSKNNEKVVENYIAMMVENLDWFYNNTTPELRQRARHWYAGANRLANRLADQYGVTIEQAAGVIAVLSPQKDWDVNVSLAERVLEALFNPDAKVTEEMIEWRLKNRSAEELTAAQQAIVDRADATANSAAVDAVVKKKAKKAKLLVTRETMAPFLGKPIGEIEASLIAAWMTRAYDQLYSNRGYWVHAPEGQRAKRATTAAEVESEAAWQSYGAINNAIMIARSQDFSLLSKTLGAAHKVRNFYNNIVDPFSPHNHVTIDTHAMGAALMAVVSGDSYEVSDALFSGVDSVAEGVTGVYPLVAEAYRRYAAKLRETGVDPTITPAQLQSIVWESVRALFPRAEKKGIADKVRAEWQKYRMGQQTAAETREAIYGIAGRKFDTPSWQDVPEAQSAGYQYSSASGLTGTQVHKLIQREFGPIARKLGVPLDMNYAAPTARYVLVGGSQGGHAIEYNPAGLADEFTVDHIRQVIRHELVHAAGAIAIKDRGLNLYEFYAEVYDALTPAEKKSLSKIYGFDKNAPKWYRGGEFIRAVIQQRVYGQLDAQYDTSKALKKVLEFIELAKNYLAKLLKKSKGTDAATVRAVIADAVGIMRAADAAAGQVIDGNEGLYQMPSQPNLPGMQPTLPGMPKDAKSFIASLDSDTYRDQMDDKAAEAYYGAPEVTEAELVQMLQAKGAVQMSGKSGSQTDLVYKLNGPGHTKLVWKLSLARGLHLSPQMADTNGLATAEFRMGAKDPRPSMQGDPTDTALQLLLQAELNSGVKSKIIARLEDVHGREYVVVEQPMMYGVADGTFTYRSPIISQILANRRYVQIPLNIANLTDKALGMHASYVVQGPNNRFYLITDLRTANVGIEGYQVGAPSKAFDLVIDVIDEQRINASPALQSAVQDILDNQQDKAHFQQNDQSLPKGRIVVNKAANGGTIVQLFQTADLSTMLHESAHLFVADMVDLVQNGFGGPQAKADLEAMFKAAGHKGGIDTPMSRESEERLARLFEEYLREGRAPSVSLADAFANFRAWLTALYRALKLTDAELTEEITGVFDRMLAAEGDIEFAKQFYSQKESMVDILMAADKKSSDLKDKRKKLQQDQLGRQTAQYLRAYLKALGGAKELRKQAAEQIDQIPVYQAIRRAAKLGIDKDALRSLLGISVSEVLAFKYPTLVKETGVFNPEELAMEFGFADVQHFAEALRDAKPYDKAVKARATEILKEKEEEIRKDIVERGATAADGVTHNDASMAYLVAEAQLLRDQASKHTAISKARLSAEAVKAAARDYIMSLVSTRAINAAYFGNLEKKFAREALDLAKKGDFAAADEAMQKMLLHHALVREALDAKRLRKAFERRYSKSSVAKILENVESQYRPVLTAILSNYKLADGPVGALTPQLLAAASEDGALEGLVAGWIKAQTNAGSSFKELTMGQIVELDRALKAIEAYGRNALLSLRGEEAMTVEAGVTESVGRMMTLKSLKVSQEGERFHPLLKKMTDLKSGIMLMQFASDIADGFESLRKGTIGFLRKLYQRMVTAELEQRDLVHATHEAASKHWELLYKAVERIRDEQGGQYFLLDTLPLPAAMERVGRGRWTGEMLVSALLNLANTGNREATKAGYNWADGFENEITKHFTTEEIAAAQAIIDVTESLYDPLNAVHFKLFNADLTRVEADPIMVQTKDGVTIFKGGYYPLIFDHQINPQAEYFNEEELWKNRMSSVFRTVTPKDGMIKERVGGQLPPKLDLGVWTDHIFDTTRYITHSLVVRDWNRITSHPAWATTFKDKLGVGSYEAMRRWLKYQAVPRNSKKVEWLDRPADWLRVRSTTSGLGFKFRTGVLQRTALFNSAIALGGFKWIARGYQVLGTKAWGTTVIGAGNSEAWQRIIEMSAYMRHREQILDREIADAVKKFREGYQTVVLHGRTFTVADFQDFAFEWIRMNDRALTSVVWTGAFHKYMEVMRPSGESIEKATDQAIAYADRIVQDTQPSSLTAELSDFGRSEGVQRFFTSFMTWSIKFGNRTSYYNRAWREGAITNKQYYAHVATEILAEPWFRALFYGVARGLPPWWAFAMAPLAALLQHIPLLRDLPQMLEPGRPMFDLDKSIAATQGLGRLNELKKQTEKIFKGEGDAGAMIWALARLAFFYYKLPIDNPVMDVKRVYDMITEDEDTRK
jgi:hypothetical protein